MTARPEETPSTAARGHLRTSGLSRVRFRQMTLNAEPPGITTSGW